MAEVKDKYQEYFKERSKGRQCSMRTTSEIQNSISFIKQIRATLPGRPDSTWTAQVIRNVKKERNQREKGV
jgi:hypothetical protein